MPLKQMISIKFAVLFNYAQKSGGLIGDLAQWYMEK